MDINQNEIDALLNGGGLPENKDETVDAAARLAQIEKENAAALNIEPDAPVPCPKPEAALKSAPAATPQPAAINPGSELPAVDTSSLLSNDADPLAQTRAAQKILFEVFSAIPEREDRSRLLNWANDAFIKSKFF